MRIKSLDVSNNAPIEDAYRNRLTLTVYWSICTFLAVAILTFLYRGIWDSAASTVFILLLIFVPAILKDRYRFYIPFALELGVTIFVFLTLFLGEVARFYDAIPLWDKFLHLQSGLILGATGYVVVYMLNEHKKIKLDLSPGFISLFAVVFSLAIGAAWEMCEFAGDNIFGSHWQASNMDTMTDLIADLVGALIMSIPGYFWMYRHKRLPFTPRFLHIFTGTPKHTRIPEEKQ